MTSTTSRRAVLAGTAALPALSVPALSATPDPIFAVIAEHEAAYREMTGWERRQHELDVAVPSDRQRTPIRCGMDADDIVETDDPRWIQHAHNWMLIYPRYDAAQWALAEIQPTTRGGLAALLQHMVEHLAREEKRFGAEFVAYAFPETTPGCGRQWHVCLIESLAKSSALTA